MKKIALLFLATAVLTFVGCSNDDDAPAQDVEVTLNFTHNFDGAAIANSDFENTTYTNANGEAMTLSKLVYLISDVTFTNAAGESFDAGDYNLIDVRNGSNLSFTPGIEIPEGQYDVSFTFGFDDNDNDNPDGYQDLNSSDGGWGVPAPLGGGYHYMRMEGTYVNSLGTTDNFQYHTIRANKHSSLPPDPTTLEELVDTSIEVDLGSVTIGSDTSIEVKMDVAQWFKSPNMWDLNTWFTVLMPNFEAQLDMSENGANVFSLGSVTQ